MNQRKNSAFPWIGLIPFVLYILVGLYVTTPNNVLYRRGLQEIGALTIPLAVLTACVCAVIGFASLPRLRGWRRVVTTVLSAVHAAACSAVGIGTLILIIMVLSGNVSV